MKEGKFKLSNIYKGYMDDKYFDEHFDVLMYIQRHTSYSYDWATKYGGYRVHEKKNGEWVDITFPHKTEKINFIIK